MEGGTSCGSTGSSRGVRRSRPADCGNIYDRRACAGLAEAGWNVPVTTVAGAWPDPLGAAPNLARIVSAIPDGEIVLIDG